jgi:glycosyltransferase involved in cell wall biosynthesis
VREQRVSTPDGRFWYVRRRWARRQLLGRRRKVYELGPAEREAVRVLPDSYDVADWYFRNFSFDAESWIILVVGLAGLVAVGGAVRVGLVATMGLWKGHEVFLRAVAALERDLPVRAYVVGGAIYGTAGSEVDPDRLRRLASELGIADRVGFTGFADAAAAMRALDVVVHASTQPEPFGLVIAEAMACARPVVVSAAGGAGEIITDSRDALGVPPGNVEAMAEAIRRLVVDADLRARMGAAGRETAERAFDRARLAAEVAPVYRSLVGEGPDGSGSGASGSDRSMSDRESSDRQNSDRSGSGGAGGG